MQLGTLIHQSEMGGGLAHQRNHQGGSTGYVMIKDNRATLVNSMNNKNPGMTRSFNNNQQQNASRPSVLVADQRKSSHLSNNNFNNHKGMSG